MNLENIKGIIHVGANIGQEIHEYYRAGIKVVWIEPIVEVFERLQENIINCKADNQIALRALVTDMDGRIYAFNVASNFGGSSSIFDFGKHTELWKRISFVDKVWIVGITLPSLLKRESIKLSDYDGLLVDVQGAEMLVLQGAEDILDNFRYIQVELPDFVSYIGGATIIETTRFLAKHGFVTKSRLWFAGKESVGNYYDVIFEKKH